MNQYDVVYKEFYELTAQSEDKGSYPVDQFYTNTGKMSFKMFCEDYAAIDFVNELNVGNRLGTRLYRCLNTYLQAMDDVAFGKAYTLDEIIYIGHTDPELAKLLARELDLEDWKRIYAGLMFGVYDGRTGKVRNLDGSKGLSDYDIQQYFYLPSKAASIVTYVGKTIGYLIEGRFANDGTVLAAAVDIGLAFFGLDLYSDLRDTAYLATHWKNNKECYLEAGLIALQYLPVIGSFTKGTKAYAVVQNSRLTCSVMETTTKVLTQVKNSGVVRYGSNLDTRLNSNMMEAFSNLSADTKKLLNDNRGMIDLDAVIETAAKECKTAEHSADDVVEILEREIKGGKNSVDTLPDGQLPSGYTNIPTK